MATAKTSTLTFRIEPGLLKRRCAWPPAGRLAFWMLLGIVVCSAGLTLAVALGLAAFQR